MNTVVAQGAPNSLIRHFQENPQEAVAIYKALIAMLEDTAKQLCGEPDLIHLSRAMAFEAIGRLPSEHRPEELRDKGRPLMVHQVQAMFDAKDKVREECERCGGRGYLGHPAQGQHGYIGTPPCPRCNGGGG